MANARRILGPGATANACARLGRAVFSSFYRSVCELAELRSATDEQIASRIARIDGIEHFLASRARGRGTLLLTAHFGAFEAGLTAMTARERCVSVLYRPDPLPGFESIRSAWRKRLGVVEISVDEGLAAWIRLRSALASNGVVAIQGDRVLPGQKGIPVPFFHGHVAIPVGPFKLARMTGASLLPVFVTRLPDGRLQVSIEDALSGNAADSAIDDVQAPIARFASLLQQVVASAPDQWLMLHRAWVEDATSDTPWGSRSSALSF